MASNDKFVFDFSSRVAVSINDYILTNNEQYTYPINTLKFKINVYGDTTDIIINDAYMIIGRLCIIEFDLSDTRINCENSWLELDTIGINGIRTVHIPPVSIAGDSLSIYNQIANLRLIIDPKASGIFSNDLKLNIFAINCRVKS